MFKKFKDKLAEEMKQSPARLQASMQQLAQAVVSPALSNSSIQELSAPNDNFSLTEEGDETPKNSPAKHGFQNVDLMSPMLNSTGISRRSSISSVTSDTSSLFPIYESPANLYHLQSDMDQSASEIDENISPQLDKVTKDYIYSAYRKVQAKYHKYRGRYTDLAAHYRDLERENSKLKSVLVESQDKALRRITDLKEQCQLEQQAKAHLEEALRNDIEEKGHIINTLNTKIKLLQSSEPNLEGVKSNANDCRENVKDNLIDLNTESSNSEFSNENVLLTENVQLKDKLKKLENVVLKYKESLKRNKEKFTEILTEKNTLESDYEALKKSYNVKEKELNYVSMEIKNVTDQMNILKKREEESVISLAENKLSIHRELEDKEEQIKQLRLDLKHMSECKDNLSETIDKYKTEVEKLKLLHSTQTSDSEKREVIQDISRGKSEALKLMQQEMQEKLINLEKKMGLKYQEEVDRNTELPKKLEKYEEDSISENTSKVDDSEILQDLKFKLDVKENELEQMKHKLEELEKLVEEYKNDKHNLSMQLVHYTELKNEQDAQKIIIEEKKKEAQTTIEKLQATVQSLDKELENMRSALVDRDEVCENYNIMLEKAKEEIKTLKEKVDDNTEINRLKKELESKIIELHGVHDELKSCNSYISDLRTKLQVVTSNTELLREEKSTLIKNISSYKNSIQKLKDDTQYVKNNVLEHSTQFSNEISDLRNVLITCLEQNGCIQNDEVQNLQTKLKDLKELRQKHDELKTELEDAICLRSSLEVDLEKYKEQLKEMSIKLVRQNELDLKNCKLIAEVDNLNFKLHDLRNLSVKVKSLQIELNSLKEELKTANATNQSLTSEVSDLKKELETANKNLKELEELKQKYMKTTETIASLKSENYNYNKLEEETKSLQSEIQFLKDNILKKDIEINTLSEELRTKEKCIETLKVDDENHVKLIEEHEKQITELTNTNKTSQKTIQTKLSQLKKLKAIKEQQDVTIQKLNDEINEIKTSNTGLLEQLKQLEKDSDALKSENCQIMTLKHNNSIIASELEQLRLIHSEINLENKNLKDKENEFLKHNQELYETNEKLTQNISHYEKHNQQLLNDSMQLNKEIELHKHRLSEQDQDIENLKSQITVLNTELQSKTEELKSQMEELALCKKEMKEMKEHLTTENERLLHEMSELKLALKDNKNTEERNKELSMGVELLEHKLTMLKSLEEENNKIKLELNSLHEEKIKSEKVHLQNNELISDNFSLKNQIKELDNLNSVNVNLQSYVQNLESKINSLEQVESENNELKTELDALEATNRVNKERLTAELDELKLVVDEKVAELKLLDTKNTELLREIERLKFSAIEEDAETEVEISKSNIEYLKEEITKLETEAKILKESNTALQKEIQNAHTNMNVDESLVKESDRLQEENKKLKAQFDEAVITFQAKESQMHIVNNELKNEADKLREESKTNEEEQSMRLKQLVKEFQAQLHDKEEELHAALEKRFDHQQNYVSDIMQQYKEQLKDLQVELTAKSEQIENLILENKNLMAQKAKDINQLMEKITLLEKEHTDELRETEKKWKSIVQQKTNNLEAKHEEEVNELTKEWQNERRPDMQTDLTTKELENTSRVAMAAVQSNTGSFHTLQQTLTAQRRELAELRKLVKLRHDTLEDSTEIEYLRNILFEYMMGRETMVLARVIAAVVKFDQEQTTKILKKEEDKMTLLGSLGLT
ncbi:golgin subfamily A member 4-like isoform X1 [Hylaeus volcanicus]|uniref:golgin subfamily A member 4-like isoform X1 n=1 Tax=Hylaeus volcanicus TaxID=313075 RepID=UPI0023B7771C|nr:golgin subfamily A member 4-like isoform X1 [Hylaeus volcanicus]